MSPVDYRSIRLDKTQARKLVFEILNRFSFNVRFSGHALKELAADNLKTGDALNVLKSTDARIYKQPDLKDGSWRYTVETNQIGVVVAFGSETHMTIVTAWRK